MSRRLIVNADDLGQSASINRGIATAVERGIVTSSSLMVRWPAAEDAAVWALAHSAVSIGLHVDLGEWTSVDGDWCRLYDVVDTASTIAVGDELSRQLGMFVRMLGRLPTHLDAHQHLQRDEPLRSHLLALGERIGAPVRDVTVGVRYCGAFYGQYGAGNPYQQGITTAALLTIFDELPDGTTELGCHPAEGPFDDLDSMYRDERATELAVLTDPMLREALDARDIELTTFDPPRHEPTLG